MLLKDGWLGEEEGMSSLSVMDISSHLMQVFPHDDNIVRRITSEYKQGKPYRYYTAKFINSIKINAITKKAQYAFSKKMSFCSENPQQRV